MKTHSVFLAVSDLDITVAGSSRASGFTFPTLDIPGAQKACAPGISGGTAVRFYWGGYHQHQLMSIGEVIRQRLAKVVRSRFVRPLAVAGFAAVAASGPPARATQYTAVDLYPMPGAGYFTPAPDSPISGAFGGQVVAGSVFWNPDGSAVDLTLSGFNGTGVAGTDGIHQVGWAITAGYIPTFTPVVWSGSPASATFLDTYKFATAAVAGSGDGQFVGSGEVQNPGFSHALLWNNLTAKPIDLSPVNLVGILDSYAKGTSGTEQVGSGVGFDANNTSYSHALLWTGSANSAVDLNPPGFSTSVAYGVLNGKQVGAAVGADDFAHAILWTSTAASAVDLHLLLPNTFQSSSAYSIDAAGNVWGVAFDLTDSQWHAIEWIPQSVPGPSLQISLSTFNTVSISWPYPSIGWMLQENTDLTTTNWVTPSQAVANDGTNNFINVGPPSGNQFFRLMAEGIIPAP